MMAVDHVVLKCLSHSGRPAPITRHDSRVLPLSEMFLLHRLLRITLNGFFRRDWSSWLAHESFDFFAAELLRLKLDLLELLRVVLASRSLRHDLHLS